MKKYTLFVLSTFLLCFGMYSCSSDTTPAVCEDNASLEFVDVSNTACGASLGSFEVELKDATNSNDAMYSINGGVKQASNRFEQLAGGSFIIQVAYGDNCVVNGEATIVNEDGLNITLLVSGSSCDGEDGQIEVVANNATGSIQYQIDGGALTSDPIFTGLGPGDYEITATDEASCVALAGGSIVGEVGFSEIENIIGTGCAISGCHNGSVSPNFTNSNNIIDKANRIRSRTGNRTMPPSNSTPLTTEQINSIDCWVSGM